MKYTFFFSFLLILSGYLFGQSARVLRFNAEASNNNKSVLVTWTMNAGSTCPSLSVEKSLNGKDFFEVYLYPSVCGSSDEALSYSWVDPSPSVYAKSFYRLNLDDIEFTVPVELDLQSLLADDNVLVFPNPSNGNFTIELRNQKSLDFDVEIFSSIGLLVFKKETCKGSSLKVNLANQIRGAYTLRITFSNKETITTSFTLE